MEARVQEAVDYITANPGLPMTKVAKHFDVPYDRLRNRRLGLQPRKGIPATNTKLSIAEEKALCLYIDRLDYINLAVRPEFVTDAANSILKERSRPNEEPLTVGHNWTICFLKRYKYFRMRQKKLNSDRQASEDFDKVN
jgi:Tc5 transposase DNA-binding domain